MPLTVLLSLAALAVPNLQAALDSAAAVDRDAVSVAIVHVETGERAALEGLRPQPLAELAALPIAVAVLQDVDAGRLSLAQARHVTSADVVPGADDARRGRVPRTVRLDDLLTRALARGDATARDVLVAAIGGVEALPPRLTALDVAGIDVTALAREESCRLRPANTASALDVARLLASVQQGAVLSARSRRRLFETMARSKASRRLRREGPRSGTPIGLGDGSVAALVTRADGAHLAIAILFGRTPTARERQEQVVAAVLRAAADLETPRGARAQRPTPTSSGPPSSRLSTSQR
jgi:beta-lactamase class A